MARPPVTADPAADAATVLRRLGFALLFLAMPVLAMFGGRTIVIVGPVAIAILVLATALGGGARPVRAQFSRLILSTRGLAAGLLLIWSLLSLIWTPFPIQAAERLFNILGTLVLVLAGYLALPERTRAANLYLLPIGVAAAALSAIVLAFFDDGSDPEHADLTLERGLIVLVLLVWPALAWLRSREREVEALLLAVAVTFAAVLAPVSRPLEGLVIGAFLFALTAARPALGVTIAAVAMAAIVMLAPLLPFVLAPLASAVFGASDPLVTSLQAWRTVVADEPLRLLTGHGFETALRGRAAGLVPAGAPRNLLFELWYELGFVGAAALAAALHAGVRRGGRDHPPLVPGLMASFAAAFALACLGTATVQMWWLTTLAVTVLVFVAASRGQFRTTRPKAILPMRSTVRPQL
jgi:hypothetical protein